MISGTVPAPQHMENALAGSAPGSEVITGPWTDTVPASNASTVEAMQRKIEQDVLLSFYRPPVLSRTAALRQQVRLWLRRF